MHPDYDDQSISGNDKIKQQIQLRHIVLLRGKENLIIPVENILYFFYENKTVFVVTIDESMFICEKSLSALEKVLCSCFFRINRQIIVNYRAIFSFYYIKKDKLQLVVKCGRGKNMIVGKNKIARFKEWIMYGCPCEMHAGKADKPGNAVK